MGASAAFLISGLIIFVGSWRDVFGFLAVVGLCFGVWTRLRMEEPERTGASELASDVTETADESADTNALRRLVEARHVAPHERAMVRSQHPSTTLASGLRYVSHVRTVIIVIIAGSFGDFFFSGVQIFAVVYAVEHYAMAQSEAALLIPVIGLGALIGLVGGGRLGDALIRRHVLTGRLQVAAWSFVLAPAAAIPVLLLHSVFLAGPAIVVGAMLVTAPTPAINAIRLDVVHPRSEAGSRQSAPWGDSWRKAARRSYSGGWPIISPEAVSPVFKRRSLSPCRCSRSAGCAFSSRCAPTPATSRRSRHRCLLRVAVDPCMAGGPTRFLRPDDR